MGRKSSRRRATGPSMASRADHHDLYQRSVQDGPSDIEFLERVWSEVYGDRSSPVHFREDFCGTALLCSHWVQGSAERTAEGFDIDEATLEWGRENNLAPIGDAATRIRLHARDVRDAGDRPADILCAQNFSYQIFHERRELADYCRKTRQHLSDEGVLVLDAFGIVAAPAATLIMRPILTRTVVFCVCGRRRGTGLLADSSLPLSTRMPLHDMYQTHIS